MDLSNYTKCKLYNDPKEMQSYDTKKNKYTYSSVCLGEIYLTFNNID